MDNFTTDDFRKLAVYDAHPAVSIYMPTHKEGWEVNEGQDRLKLKNHLQTIAHHLDKDRHNRDFLKPAFDLLEDQQFWTRQDEGLCLFLAPGIFKSYRMPFRFTERYVINQHFHLTPMLRFCQKESHYFVLSLSMQSVRLFSCNDHHIHEMPLDPSVPRSMEDALWMDDPEVQQQFHSAGRPPAGSIYHGQGGGEDRIKTDLLRYCNKVDNGIFKMIGSKNDPLVIAAVDYLIPIYRETSQYKFIFPEGVKGNHELTDINELHRLSWNLVAPYFEKEKVKAIDRFNNLQRSALVSDSLEDIVPASKFSKVDVLFVSDEDPVWGKFNESAAKVEVHGSYEEGDEDLLNRAAVETFLNGGRVFVLDKKHLPQDARHMAAIYRFP